MKQPHGPKELGREAHASLGLSDDDQMSRLCPSLPTTHQMHRSDGSCVLHALEQGTPCLVFLWMHRDGLGHKGAMTARTRQGRRLPLSPSVSAGKGVCGIQYVRCDLWCEVCSVQCCMWWGDMILTYIHGGDRLVTVVTSKRLAMGGSRKSSRLVDLLEPVPYLGPSDHSPSPGQR